MGDRKWRAIEEQARVGKYNLCVVVKREDHMTGGIVWEWEIYHHGSYVEGGRCATRRAAEAAASSAAMTYEKARGEGRRKP